MKRGCHSFRPKPKDGETSREHFLFRTRVVPELDRERRPRCSDSAAPTLRMDQS